MDFGRQKVWAPAPTLPLPSWVTLGKAFGSFGSVSSPLKTGIRLRDLKRRKPRVNSLFSPVNQKAEFTIRTYNPFQNSLSETSQSSPSPSEQRIYLVTWVSELLLDSSDSAAAHQVHSQEPHGPDSDSFLCALLMLLGSSHIPSTS